GSYGPGIYADGRVIVEPGSRGIQIGSGGTLKVAPGSEVFVESGSDIQIGSGGSLKVAPGSAVALGGVIDIAGGASLVVGYASRVTLGHWTGIDVGPGGSLTVGPNAVLHMQHGPPTGLDPRDSPYRNLPMFQTAFLQANAPLEINSSGVFINDGASFIIQTPV